MRFTVLDLYTDQGKLDEKVYQCALVRLQRVLSTSHGYCRRVQGPIGVPKIAETNGLTHNAQRRPESGAGMPNNRPGKGPSLKFRRLVEFCDGWVSRRQGIMRAQFTACKKCVPICS